MQQERFVPPVVGYPFHTGQCADSAVPKYNKEVIAMLLLGHFYIKY